MKKWLALFLCVAMFMLQTVMAQGNGRICIACSIGGNQTEGESPGALPDTFHAMQDKNFAESMQILHEESLWIMDSYPASHVQQGKDHMQVWLRIEKTCGNGRKHRRFHMFSLMAHHAVYYRLEARPSSYSRPRT